MKGFSSIKNTAGEAFVKPTQDEFGRIIETAGSSITGKASNTSSSLNSNNQPFQSGNKPNASQKTPEDLAKIKQINTFLEASKKDYSRFQTEQQRIKQEKAQQVQVEMDQKKKEELERQQGTLIQPSSKGGIKEKIGDMWSKARRVEVKGKTG